MYRTTLDAGFPRSRLALLLAVQVLFISASARADEDAERVQAAAKELYDAARVEMEAGQFQRACGRLETARTMLPGHIRTGITLAECYRLSGKPFSAWKELSRVKPLAVLQGKGDKSQEISERLASVEPTIPKITIGVPEKVRKVPSVSITLDAGPFPEAQWGKPLALDPGLHTIRVTAPSLEAWVKEVELKADGKTVAIEVGRPRMPEDPEPEAQEPPPDEKAAPAPAPSSPPYWRWQPPPPWSSDTDQDDLGAKPLGTSSTMATLGVAGMALGGASIALGAVFGGLAMARNKESSAGCDAQDRCNQAGYDLRRSALTFGNASTGTFVGGGALFTAGLITFLRWRSTSKKDDPKGSAPAISLHIQPTGLQIRGSF